MDRYPSQPDTGTEHSGCDVDWFACDIAEAYVSGEIASTKLTERHLESADIYGEDELLEYLEQNVQVALLAYRHRVNAEDPDRPTSRELRRSYRGNSSGRYTAEQDRQRNEFWYAQRSWEQIRESLDIIQHGGNTTVSYNGL